MILSKRSWKTLSKSYMEKTGLRAELLNREGVIESPGAPDIARIPRVQQVRSHALQEAVRWGDVYFYFLAPGIISWVIPLANGYAVLGGVNGGHVVAEDELLDRMESMDHLEHLGCSRTLAQQFVDALPAWPQARTQQAADQLKHLSNQVTGWTSDFLQEQKLRAQQQSQIAEEIHRRKQAKRSDYPMDEEQILLSLIRAGDRRGARKILNQMLGAIFLRSAKLVVVQALMIELMGYLVRRAIEDSPFLQPLMERNHVWMAAIMNAEDFEHLSTVLRETLDDFMENIFQMGYRVSNRHVSGALDYLAEHYRESVALSDVAEAAGLSTYRIAHLVKEQTGRSIIQHVHHMRIQEARRLLTETDQSCTDIALEVGFCDQSYFTRKFKAQTGITPARFRNSHQPRT